MKRISLMLVFALCTTLTNAQYGKISLNDIRQLKDDNMIYVRLLNEIDKGESVTKVNDELVKSIKDYWTLTNYKVLEYEEYTQLQEDGNLDENYVLTLQRVKYGHSDNINPGFTITYHYFLVIAKGDHSFKVNSGTLAGFFLGSSFSSSGAMIQRMIPLYTNALQQYLIDALEQNTTDPFKIAESNGYYLKERKLIFLVDHLKKSVSNKIGKYYTNDFEVESNMRKYIDYYSEIGESNAIYLKTYNPFNLSWYNLVIETIDGKMVYLEDDGLLGITKKVSKDTLQNLEEASSK